MPFTIFNVISSVTFTWIHIDVDEIAVECPTSENHVTDLFIKRKITYIDTACTLEYNRWQPGYIACIFYDCIRWYTWCSCPNISIVNFFFYSILKYCLTKILILLKLIYLPSKISGFHIFSVGICINSIPSYKFGSHFSLLSIQS